MCPASTVEKAKRVLKINGGKVSVLGHHFFIWYETIIVSNLPQWDISFCKNEWKSGGAIQKVIGAYSLLRYKIDTGY